MTEFEGIASQYAMTAREEVAAIVWRAMQDAFFAACLKKPITMDPAFAAAERILALPHLAGPVAQSETIRSLVLRLDKIAECFDEFESSGAEACFGTAQQWLDGRADPEER